MPFDYPATEIFDAQGARRVVWSREEYAQAIAAGYTDERPAEPAPEMIQEEPATTSRLRRYKGAS